MEYKICENCNEKLHVRTQRCPFCNSVLTEKSQIIQENVEDKEIPKPEENLIDISITDETDNLVRKTENNITDKEVKDYVYKAEVRHSLEYTKQMSNVLKVFITAISMIPVIGQIIGTFFGVFFLTYEDNDRKSFGRSLIGLSIIMFIIYAYNVIIFSELIKTEGLSSLMQQM